MKNLTAKEITKTLLDKGELVLGDYEQSQRQQIQQTIFRVKRRLGKKDIGVVPIYDGYLISSYRLISSDNKMIKGRVANQAAESEDLRRLLHGKTAIYSVICKKIIAINSDKILESQLKNINNQNVLRSVLIDLGYTKYDGVWQK